MKKYTYILFFLIGMMMVGCSSDSPLVIKQYGTIQCINNNSDPYIVTIKGNTSLSFTLEARKSITKSVEVGYYDVHVKQKSGYLFYPTEKDYEFYVQDNQNHVISF